MARLTHGINGLSETIGVSHAGDVAIITIERESRTVDSPFEVTVDGEGFKVERGTDRSWIITHKGSQFQFWVHYQRIQWRLHCLDWIAHADRSWVFSWNAQSALTSSDRKVAAP